MKITGKLNLAKAFKVSRTTIENWCKSGCPSKFNGKEHEFVLSEVIGWHEKKFLKNDSDTESLTKARAVIAHYKGLITEIEYKEKCAELVPVRYVKEIAFNSARLTRDSIFNVPVRLSPILAAESDVKKCHKLLMDEIRQCLENLANQYCDGTIIQKLLNEKESEEK